MAKGFIPVLRFALLGVCCFVVASCGKMTGSKAGSVIGSEDAAYEHAFQPDYLKLASGFQPKSRHPWPFHLSSIGHTISSYQSYGGGAYFHPGIDIMADAGTVVTASAGGKVVNIENYGGTDAYWEVAVLDDDGLIWQYHHVDHDSIPQAIHKAFETGAKIAAGTVIGKIYHWEIESFGALFHHIHLNVRGKGKVYLNPFDSLEPLSDNKGPIIHSIGILKSGDVSSATTVSGDYGLYINVDDLILHDKYIVPPYSIVYSVDGQTSEEVWKFDMVPGGSDESAYVNDYFVTSKTCGDYDCRRFFINMGFALKTPKKFPTKAGRHDVAVTVTDFMGNVATQQFSWTVR